MVNMWWIVEWTVVGFGRSDMLYNNYRNSFWKAVFQNRKIVSDAIWGGGNIINRQVRKMYLIKTVKGDITKVTDVQAIVNAAKIAVRTVARFLQENPGQFDLVEWMLFDSHTESVYEAEVDQLYKMIQ